jgi:xanthine dehydrogenase accessory factor
MDFLGLLIEALGREPQVFLATIISVKGSSPAPVLSRMIVALDGRILGGTLGGGCTENDIRTAAIDSGRSPASRVLSFGFSEDHVELGPICGGTIEVLIEPLTKDDQAVYLKLRDATEQGIDALLATGHSEGGERIFKTVLDQEGPGHPMLAEALGDMHLTVSEFHEGSGARRFPLPKGEVIVEPFRGRPEAIIFGGGHVGQSVAHVAAFAGFRVTVVDDRLRYAFNERFPDADRTLVLPFDKAFASLSIGPTTYLVIVTRGHQHDETVLRQALLTPAKYIGMIGSRRKVELAFQHLRAEGISDALLRRVYGPVGIDIKARTVEEIALSIVSEMIVVRRGEGSPLAHKRITPS